MSKKTWIHLGLFVLTFILTTLSGAELASNKHLIFGKESLNWADLEQGFWYALAFIGVLTVHEFGHYFMARYYQIKVSLPYYIPMYVGFLGSISIGTMGAVIRIKDRIQSKKQYFDVGIAGPLAGFVVALGVLWYGFTHLPEPDYIFEIHPEYLTHGEDYADHVYGDEAAFRLGDNLLFVFFKNYVASDPARVPNNYELIHFPFLFAGYLALFFTALNLLPIGQLDGGHILYGLFGFRRSRWVSAVVFLAFVFYAGLGLITPFDDPNELLWTLPVYGVFLYFVFMSMSPEPKNRALLAVATVSSQFFFSYFFPSVEGYMGWLFFAFLIGRFLGVYHPPAPDERPLSLGRKILGWLCLAIFVLCFTPQPFAF